MKNKKIIALILTVALLFSTMVMSGSADPASLSETATEPLGVDTTGYNVIFSDTFSDGTVCGWSKGAGYKQVTLTSDSQTGVLEVVLPGSNSAPSWAATENQSTITKAIATPVVFSEDNLVIIKARVKSNTGDAYLIKVNRPDKIGWGNVPLGVFNDHAYAVAGLNGGKPVYGSTLSGSYKNLSSAIYLPNGTTFDYTGVSFADKWIDYKIIINGATNEQWVEASFEHNNQTVTVMSGTNSTFSQSADAYKYAGREGNTTFSALERLTFASRSTSEQTLYIDSVSVETFSLSDVEVTVPANRVEGIIYKPQSIDVKFGGPINYVNNGITIEDNSGNIVFHSGQYNAQTMTYKAEFENILPAGEYTVKIGNAIVPSSPLPEGATDMGFVSRSVGFTVYDSLPPSITNVTISGRLIPNQIIEVTDYDYSDENGAQGNHIYEWFMSSAPDGTYEPITGANTSSLIVTDAIAQKYIKLKMTAVSASGLVGYSDESNIIIPEAAPTISNYNLSTTRPFTNTDIWVNYEYDDVNGDEEEGTEIIWYVGDTAGDVNTQVGTGKIYRVSGSDAGKYIRCTIVPKNTAVMFESGSMYESETVGPVCLESQLLEGTNLLLNPSFENGLEHYDASSDIWSPNIEPLYGEARTGGISLRLHKRNTDASLHATWGQNVTVKANKRYLAGCYAKSLDGAKREIQSFYAYVPGLTNLDTNVNGVDKSSTNVSSMKFHQVVSALESSADATVKVGFTSFVSRSICDANVDDMYFGELLITDINTNYVDEITIPKDGEKKVSLTNGIIYNQLGTQHGLYDQTPVIEIPQIKGVCVDGYDLVITDQATAGTVTADVVVRPSYQGAAQSEVKKTISFNLVSHGDNSPRVKDVVISGTFGTGNELTGTYKFLQVDGKSDASIIKWMYSDNYEGPYNEIQGADTLTYTVDGAYADKFICMEVTPVAADGTTGKAVRSNVLTKARAPVAKNVVIKGSFTIGGTVKAEYDFIDYNNETATPAATYIWYMLNTETGIFEPITGVSEQEISLTNDYVGKQFKVGVTPVSEEQPSPGVEELSSAYSGPAKPVITDLSIKQSGTLLVADYIYSHLHGISESGTVYQWTVDGNVVSTSTDYTIDFYDIKTVTLSVTPRAAEEPSQGETVSVTGTFTGMMYPNIGGGGGFVSGGGGGGSVSGVTSVNDMTLAEQNTKPETKSDIAGHWGETYIKNMVHYGVMNSDENGNYQPDEFSTREKMLTYLFKALKLEKTEYNNEFQDIEDGEFAKMLQTMVNNGTIAKDENFRPNDTITREEMCKILYISLDNAGKLKKYDEMLIEGFADFTNISDWANEYVNAIYGNKIMVGVSDTEFDPKGTVTKAQAATMLTRILKLMEGATE